MTDACNGDSPVTKCKFAGTQKWLTVVLQEVCQAEGVGIGQCDAYAAEQPYVSAVLLCNGLLWCSCTWLVMPSRSSGTLRQ